MKIAVIEQVHHREAGVPFAKNTYTAARQSGKEIASQPLDGHKAAQEVLNYLHPIYNLNIEKQRQRRKVPQKQATNRSNCATSPVEALGVGAKDAEASAVLHQISHFCSGGGWGGRKTPKRR